MEVKVEVKMGVAHCIFFISMVFAAFGKSGQMICFVLCAAHNFLFYFH